MPILATSNGLTSGDPVNDAFGSSTQTAGTAITRAIPPRVGTRAHVSGFSYTAAATAHTVTMLTVLDTKSVASEAAASQAVVALNSIPTAADGSILAANDYLILQYEDGSWEPHLVSSLSGLNVTVSASFSKKILKGSTAYFMGAPGDHSNRQYTIDASQTFTIAGSTDRVCAAAATAKNQPILVHSNNATNAGILRWVAYSYAE